MFPMDVQAAKQRTTAAKRPAYMTRVIRELQVVRILGPIPLMSKYFLVSYCNKLALSGCSKQ